MPIALVFTKGGAIPAVLQEDTADALVKALGGLQEAPALKNEEEARIWLQQLPMPSGWFASIEEARAHLKRWKEETPPLTKEEVQEARKNLGMSQTEFATAIGIGGNPDTRRRFITAVEKGEIQPKTSAPRTLSIDATRRLRALMAENGLNFSAS